MCCIATLLVTEEDEERILPSFCCKNGHVVVRKALLVHPRLRITRSSATRRSCGERQQEYVPVCLCSSGLKFLFNSETTVRGVLAYAS